MAKRTATTGTARTIDERMIDERPARGRPRDEETRRRILDTALRICTHEGYAALTMKGLADAAGVGRQTIYRWWPTKQDVLLEALDDIAVHEIPRLPHTDDPLADLRHALRLTFRLVPERTGAALGGLMADAQHDPGLAERLQATLLGPRRALLGQIIRRGIRQGRLVGRVRVPLVVDMIFGTMWYRLMGRHAAVDDRLAADLVRVVERLLGP